MAGLHRSFAQWDGIFFKIKLLLRGIRPFFSVFFLLRAIFDRGNFLVIV